MLLGDMVAGPGLPSQHKTVLCKTASASQVFTVCLKDDNYCLVVLQKDRTGRNFRVTSLAEETACANVVRHFVDHYRPPKLSHYVLNGTL
jgi:hypothetical protein